MNSLISGFLNGGLVHLGELTQWTIVEAFIPHGHCYLWKPDLVGLHLVSDALIALAYYSIPLTLFYFVRQREDLPFDWIFLLFGTFIIACGTTHLMGIWTLWHPSYWLSGTIKLVTAVVSVYTAVLLVPLVPQALALPSPAQLETANQELRNQIAEREQAEEQIRTLNMKLEQRVVERTAQLEAANQLKDELLVREQEARASAEAANRAKDEFLSILSHELRTPLNAMLGWSQLLRSQKLNEATRSRGLEAIERNARGQANLIEDLLDISRIITGKLRLHVRPIELVPVIEAAIDTVRPAADAKQLQIQSVLDPLAGLVSGDSDRLQQIVWNLLANAIKFTPKGGQVQVRLERVNSHVEIIVSDTGQGISADFLPYIFERFRQADSTHTRSHGGLGLGLAIVRHLVELHGGSVQAQSPGEGQGSTFVVQLPVTAVLNTNESERVHSTVSSEVSFDYAPTLSGLKLLVVDDEPDARDLLSTVLQECGALVTAVASVTDAIAAIEQFQPDILVSDIGMPGEDGYSLISRIRAMEAQNVGRIPAVALTAYARVEDRTRALAAGFQMHIAKPVNPTELVAVIANLAGWKGVLNVEF
ncbi:hybrid sensor histidine kinase/response regulator [Gloeocapsopsis dulcis]|uniref:Circadian input-output histidine kinase CikA n=1 Tax=Gloeocapsopsis dulcis AAB1 = 1H9 TaxID=1433147 RepID=A0A6N8FY41_9CHRO|nr:ATP-binding protein [Gloeocapsopsis dulcis]MUL36836.1 hybrid sensor histidine kinase/response regulator [Gloeocapsopsis dulcis AAB1 = 1H9]WNN88558.1 ATP-binding protein [Gloeocapsopsis dulcis]